MKSGSGTACGVFPKKRDGDEGRRRSEFQRRGRMGRSGERDGERMGREEYEVVR